MPIQKKGDKTVEQIEKIKAESWMKTHRFNSLPHSERHVSLNGRSFAFVHGKWHLVRLI